MININTLNDMEDLGIGPNIDKLENMMALNYYGYSLGNNLASDEDYDRLKNLLKLLKPDSKVIESFPKVPSLPLTKYDDLFAKYGYDKLNKVCDLNKESLAGFINKCGNNEDILALAIPDGIEVRLIYTEGYYDMAYTYCRENKGKFISGHLDNLVPDFIVGLSKTKRAELRAIITTSDAGVGSKEDKELDKLTSIVRYLKNNYSEKDSSKFKVYVYDAYVSDDSDLIKCNEWTLLDKLRANGVNLVTFALIRDIPKAAVYEAVCQLQKYFNEPENKKYNMAEMDVMYNSLKYDKDARVYIDLKHRKNVMYSSEIVDIDWKYGNDEFTPKIEIKPVMVGDQRTIKILTLPRLKSLLDSGLHIGSKIYFYVDYVNNVIVCDSNGYKIV